MPVDREISQASFKRAAATARMISIVAAIINVPFLLLALSGQIWLRVGILAFAEIGFLLSIYMCHPQRYRAVTPWLVVASCWFAVINAVCTNGAGMGHVTVLWFSIIICIAGLIGSYRFCISWSVIAIISVLVVFTLELLGIELPNLTPFKQQYFLVTLHTFAQVILVGALVLTYQRALAGFEVQVHQKIDQVQAEVVQRELAEAAALKSAHDKDQFLRNLSHEFRTPLNSIIGFSERLLKKYSGDVTLTKGLEAVNRNGKSLHYLVSELLLLDAVEATALDLHKARLSDLVESVIKANEALANRYDITFEYVTEEGYTEQDVNVDVARLTLAISCVVLFCIRQSPPGTISVSLDRKQDHYLITFIDCAKTMPKEVHASMFETHYEYVLSNDKDIPSSAFALKIAALIVARHGGTISSSPSETHDGQGNRITITL
jgi:signal transduction histidine kinase